MTDQFHVPAALPSVPIGVDPRAGPDDVEKKKCLTLPELELLPLGSPATSVVGIPTDLSRFLHK
jgi:hypothetical protein